MKKVTQLLLLFVTVTAFTACSSSNKVSTNPADILGDWQLTSLNGNTDVSGNPTYTLSFNTDGTVAGKASCNYFAGKYSAQEEGVVQLNSVSSTEVTCESNNMVDSYVNALKNASSFGVKGGNQLMLNTGSEELVFSKVMKEKS